MREIINIRTQNTSYILGVLKSGHLSCLHYGADITAEDYSALFERFDIGYGSMVAYSDDDPAFGLDDVCLEYGTLNKGDFREPALMLKMHNGATVCDLKFFSHEIIGDKPEIEGLPSAICEDDEVTTHLVILKDSCSGITVKLYYSAFYQSDVIAKRAEIINDSGGEVTVLRAMSQQLDLPCADYRLMTFTGAWSLERQTTENRLSPGIYVNDSKVGSSSSRANPFIMLAAEDATLHCGSVYGFNLIYSGNHAEILEVTASRRLRVVSGINPNGFSWRLSSGERFCTPEAIVSWSGGGLNGISKNMHKFIRQNVVRGEWKYKERPVLVNNWEGTWMDFDEKKLLSIAKHAKELGAELFVLDDGWFVGRNDDTGGLGDWETDTKKLPRGLDGLQKRIAEMGMDFGLWVEPEMISPRSSLYDRHPDWAIATPGYEPSRGRNQLVLDLTKAEVRQYILESMRRVFSLCELSYVKWDFNRNFSDVYSSSLPADRQGEFAHRYYLGLYEILGKLTSEFPHILFESCASGGNRFDLGMLAYMPQIWASDNTDPVCRMSIQSGTYYGYPQSVVGAHVSASPSQATLRQTPVETRFNVAAFGLLGYEMDLTELTPFDKNAIKEQIEYYKLHRRLLQFGNLVRMSSPESAQRFIWLVQDGEGSEGIAVFFQQTAQASHTHDILLLTGFDETKTFTVTGRTQYLNIKAFGSLVKHAMPVRLKGDGVPMTVLASRYMFRVTDEEYTASGSILNKAGIRLKQQYGSTGYNENIRVMGDYGSRMYHIREQTSVE